MKTELTVTYSSNIRIDCMIIQIVVGCFVCNKLGHLDNFLLLQYGYTTDFKFTSLGVLKGIEILNEPFIFNQFEIVLPFIKRVDSMVEETQQLARGRMHALTYLLAK